MGNETPTNDAPVTVEPAAYLYESEGYGRELVFDCNGEHARRLIELGYTETPLFDHRLAALASAPRNERKTYEWLPDEEWLAGIISKSIDIDWAGPIAARAIIAAWGDRF